MIATSAMNNIQSRLSHGKKDLLTLNQNVIS